MEWWAWTILGLALLAVEMATPGGFFFLFFGAAALVVSALCGLGFGGPAWLQWLLFSLLSVISLLLLRGPLQARMMRSATSEDVDSLVGEIAVLLEDLPPGGIAKAELRGTSWTARCSGGTGLSRGQRCRVERVQGLTLWIRPD